MLLVIYFIYFVSKKRLKAGLAYTRKPALTNTFAIAHRFSMESVEQM